MPISTDEEKGVTFSISPPLSPNRSSRVTIFGKTPFHPIAHFGPKLMGMLWGGDGLIDGTILLASNLGKQPPEVVGTIIKIDASGLLTVREEGTRLIKKVSVHPRILMTISKDSIVKKTNLRLHVGDKVAYVAPRQYENFKSYWFRYSQWYNDYTRRKYEEIESAFNPDGSWNVERLFPKTIVVPAAWNRKVSQIIWNLLPEKMEADLGLAPYRHSRDSDVAFVTSVFGRNYWRQTLAPLMMDVGAEQLERRISGKPLPATARAIVAAQKSRIINSAIYESLDAIADALDACPGFRNKAGKTDIRIRNKFKEIVEIYKKPPAIAKLPISGAKSLTDYQIMVALVGVLLRRQALEHTIPHISYILKGHALNAISKPVDKNNYEESGGFSGASHLTQWFDSTNILTKSISSHLPADSDLSLPELNPYIMQVMHHILLWQDRWNDPNFGCGDLLDPEEQVKVEGDFQRFMQVVIEKDVPLPDPGLPLPNFRKPTVLHVRQFEVAARLARLMGPKMIELEVKMRQATDQRPITNTLLAAFLADYLLREGSSVSPEKNKADQKTGSQFDLQKELVQLFMGYIPKALRLTAAKWIHDHHSEKVGELEGRDTPIEDGHATDMREVTSHYILTKIKGADPEQSIERCLAMLDMVIDWSAARYEHLRVLADLFMENKDNGCAIPARPGEFPDYAPSERSPSTNMIAFAAGSGKETLVTLAA